MILKGPGIGLRAVLWAASLLAVSFSLAQAEVRLPNGECRTGQAVLKVKALGGYVTMGRTWQAVNLNREQHRWYVIRPVRNWNWISTVATSRSARSSARLRRSGPPEGRDAAGIAAAESGQPERADGGTVPPTTPGTTGDVSCVRKYSDEQIFSLVKDRLRIGGEYKIYINWRNCKYYILMYPLPIIVDNQKIVVVDSDGVIVEGPR